MIYHIWCNYVSGVKSQLFYSDEHSVMWIKLSWCNSCWNKLWNQLVIWQSYLVQKLVPEEGQLVHHGVTSASCQQTYMTYTIAVCTAKNSWWWTEELSETCRISFQE